MRVERSSLLHNNQQQPTTNQRHFKANQLSPPAHKTDFSYLVFFIRLHIEGQLAFLYKHWRKKEETYALKQTHIYRYTQTHGQKHMESKESISSETHLKWNSSFLSNLFVEKHSLLIINIISSLLFVCTHFVTSTERKSMRTKGFLQDIIQ